MKPTLLILAAGMGSRYGGLKQIDPIGPGGELIIDYSIYDAVKAGFGKVAFVIRQSCEQDFKERFQNKYGDRIPVSFAYQELENFTGDFQIPTEREKPWGTGHAILVAKDVVNEPFTVINADDYYGPETFKLVAKYLTNTQTSSREYCMAGFHLTNTLSEHGSVSRGVTKVDERMLLKKVTEHTDIERKNDKVLSLDQQGNEHRLTGNEIVSMNFWGFKPSIFGYLEDQFKTFLKDHGSELRSEFYIPAAVDRLIQEKTVSVKVLKTSAKWFGVTYRQDKIAAEQNIADLVNKGVYPERLWRS